MLNNSQKTPTFHLSIGSKIILSAIIPMILMTVIAVVVYINIEKTITTAQWVEHTHSVTEKSHELVKLMLDMETGERGYLITANPLFLAPFNDAKRIWRAHTEGLKALVADNPPQVARIIKIEQLQKQWLKEVAEVEISARITANNNNPNDSEKNKIQALDKVVKLVENKTGKDIIDAIRNIQEHFIAEEKNY